MPKFSNQQLVPRARKLRKAMPVAEEKMWAELRAGRLMGLKFRRQVPIERYIVDFACAERRLIVEIDGPSHSDAPARLADLRRDETLKRAGWQVVRATNEEAIFHRDAVCRAILIAAGFQC